MKRDILDKCIKPLSIVCLYRYNIPMSQAFFVFTPYALSLTAPIISCKKSCFLIECAKILKRENLGRQDRDASDFDSVIKRHVWKLIGIGAGFGAVAVIVFFAGYHFAGRSTFCGSCHSMENNYFTWKVSRHKQFACIECHLPAGNIAYTVLYKAYAGARDVAGETARSYPFTIKLTNTARTIANSNCSRCHFSTIETTSMVKTNADCMKCHKFLVHGRPVMHGGTF